MGCAHVWMIIVHVVLRHYRGCQRRLRGLKTTNAVLWMVRHRLLLTRGPTSTWRLSALPTQRALALEEVSVQHFQTVRTRPSRSTSAVAARPKPDIFADLPHEPKTIWTESNYKSNRKKQPAHHARSTTNVHRARHAESCAHCVNCDTNCFKTSNANLLRDSFNPLAQQRMRSSGLTELLLAFNPAASHRHVPRRFQIRCVLLHHTASSLHSTNRRLASRFLQIVSKFIRRVWILDPF